MKTVILSLLLFLSFSPAQTIRSPQGKLSLTFALTNDGAPTYALRFGNKPIINTSTLGIQLKGEPSFDKGFVMASVDTLTHDETWEPVWGEVKRIRSHFRELAVTLRQPSIQHRTMVVRFRLFDDGVGFRYEFPRQDPL
ncbi:MAG: glycoside hydrolase family 97 N-terminal domain-containing protein, partial [Bacteroidota bacterium]